MKAGIIYRYKSPSGKQTRTGLTFKYTDFESGDTN